VSESLGSAAGGARAEVAVVHDYLTQRGGAERVVLAILEAFPRAPLYTSLYDPARTFADYRDVDVRPLWLNRLAPLRRWHRLALPVLAPAFAGLDVRADVVVCSSSGWAHGVRTAGRKIVYCHAPARWLYQPERYLRGRRGPAGVMLGLLRRRLIEWDRRGAASADRYLANSTEVARWISSLYGIEAEVLPPPPALDPQGPQRPVPGIEPGFALCVSRLLPYKNVDAVVEAFARMREQLVVVGSGPEQRKLAARAPENVRFVSAVEDDELRWLYRSCSIHVSASYEDFGLTPLEAAAFGRPSAVLRFGGFLDTVIDGATGIFFDEPTPEAVRAAVEEARGRTWGGETLRRHADRFSKRRFVDRLRTVVAEELGQASKPIGEKSTSG
jgi:glycosyltransferase involved in cell wall biosynthesis